MIQKAESLNLVFIHLSICYSDYQLERNAELAPEYMDDRIGFYWYFRPKYDPVKQADYFWNLIGGYTWGALVVDCEAAGATYATMRKNTEIMAAQVYQMCELEPVLIYTRASYWNHVIGDQPWAAIYDLWIARYHSGISHPWGDGKCKPLGWDDWKFWQWSADGNGMGPYYGGQAASMDLNRFNGTMADLNRYFGVVDVEPYETEIDVPKDVERIVININRI